MHTPGLIKSNSAGGAIAARRIVKHGATDGTATQAGASTDLLLGVTTAIGASAIGERVDVVLTGTADVEYGAVVTRGQLLTADASGKAIPAAPAAGANVRTIGVALVSGVAGDIGTALLSPGSMQG